MRLISQQRSNLDGPPELNLAPLIDMVFILLIFFLVTTTFVRDTGVPVERPAAATAETLPDQGLLITLATEGETYMDGAEVAPTDLAPRIRLALGRRPDLAVVILADKASRNEDLVRVLDACRSAGAKKISLAAERR